MKLKLLEEELYYDHEKNLILLDQQIKLPYFKKLIKIRNVLEKRLKNFPIGCCNETSRIIKKTIGLEEVAGDYIEKNNLILHAWNYDKENRLYIDLTHDQFEPFKTKISIFPLNINFLKISSNRSIFI